METAFRKTPDATHLAFKIRITFSRDELGCFFPHQDVLTAFSRAVRRTTVPVRFTEGFDPHPRISLPYALSVGIRSDVEVLEMELCSWKKPSEAAQALNDFLPRGIRTVGAKLVEARRSSCVVTSMTFEAELSDDQAAVARDAIPAVLSLESIIVERGETEAKKRKVDIRKFVTSLDLSENTLKMVVRFTPTGSAKPREVIVAVIGSNWDVRLVPVRKTAMEIQDAD